MNRMDSSSFIERRRRFRDVRKALKLSQEEVAKFTGITQGTLSGFERGKHDLSPETYTRLEQALIELESRSRKQMEAALRLGIDPKRASKPTLMSAEQASRVREAASRLLARFNTDFPPPSDPLADKLMKAYAEIHELRGQVSTMKQLIDRQSNLLDGFVSACKDDIVPELRQKDARITDLEKQVADLRALYEAETEAALAYDKARELRDKLTGKGGQ